MSEMQKVYQFRILSLHQMKKVYEIAKNLKKKTHKTPQSIKNNTRRNRKSVNE